MIQIKNKKAEIATITAVILTLTLLSSILILNQYRGITGFAALELDNVSEQSVNNTLILDFNVSGDQTVYLDLDNYSYSDATIDVTGINISSPSVDILDNELIDWEYTGKFDSTETIDFIGALNDYIPNCGSYPCTVPIKVSANSTGRIILENLVLQYIEFPEINETVNETINKTINQTDNITDIKPQNKTFEKINKQVVEKVKKERRARVIVILKKPKKPRFKAEEKEKQIEEIKEQVKSNQEKVLSQLKVKKKTKDSFLIQGKVVEEIKEDFELEKQYKTTSALSGYVTESGLEKLEADPDVTQVIIDPIFEINLDESIPIIKADQAWNYSNKSLDGSTETICIVDTGIDTDHPAFNGRIKDEYCSCFIPDYGSGGCCPNDQSEDNNSAEDDNDHGTHVAGIAAANGQLKGTAPNASLVIAKACDSAGDCLGSDILAGIDWCIDNKDEYNISVISLSLGDNQEHNSTCTGPLDDALETANNQEIFVAAASGNEGYSDGINYPACSQYVTSVGATDKDDNIASFTNLAPYLDLLAPGVDINSTTIGGYGVKSGTSMATPHVAGAAALVIQDKKQKDESTSPSDIENDLRANGVMIDAYERIDVLETVKEYEIQQEECNTSKPGPCYEEDGSWKYDCENPECSGCPECEEYADFGDAPDSINHNNSGMPPPYMTAYTGINASFPTVHDPTLKDSAGAPYGPCHNTMYAVLGNQSTNETDADLLPDQDMVINIDPFFDSADQDSFNLPFQMDDGLKHIPINTTQSILNITNCSTTTIPVEINIYKASGFSADWNATLNIWIDYNRDGDWGTSTAADSVTCSSSGDTSEWVVKNYVAASISQSMTGPGTIIVNPSFIGYVPSPPGNDVWMRVQLTPGPINEFSYADGSGPSTCYEDGETEDYYLYIEKASETITPCNIENETGCILREECLWDGERYNPLTDDIGYCTTNCSSLNQKTCEMYPFECEWYSGNCIDMGCFDTYAQVECDPYDQCYHDGNDCKVNCSFFTYDNSFWFNSSGDYFENASLWCLKADCEWNGTYCIEYIPPNTTKFNTSYGSTNFSDPSLDLTNVTNMTLANQNGRIQFPSNYGVYASGEDYDSSINIGSGFISVNTSALDPSFNSTANLTINNVDSCIATTPNIYYRTGHFSLANDILNAGQICNSTTDPSCTNINCIGSTLTFTVSHFTGFAPGTNSNLTIWDETDPGMPYGDQIKNPGDQVKFFANYTNSTGTIQGADCSIYFNDSNASMIWNATTSLYEYNRNFSLPGLYNWNVTCNKTGYDTLTANDTVNISAPAGVCFCYNCSNCTSTLNKVGCSEVRLATSFNTTDPYCINISQHNQVFDCQQNIINYTGGFSNARDGIRNDGYDNVTIKNCNIQNYVYIASGIHFLNDSTDGHIFNNTIENCDTGINIEDSDRPAITQNRISSGGSSGIYIENTYDSVVSNNNISSMAGRGIYIRRDTIAKPIVTGHSVTDNYIFGCQDPGISFEGVNNSVIDNNTLISNSGSGIILDTSSNNDITNNTAEMLSLPLSQIQYNGIYLYSNSNFNNVIDNKAKNNRMRGLYIRSSSNNIITNNELINNTEDGIRIESNSQYNTLSFNNASLNKEYSYYIDYQNGDCSNIINDNNIGGDDGKLFKYIRNQNSISLSDQEYSGLALCNISTSVFDNITIDNGDSLNTTSDGIFVISSDHITFENSTLVNDFYGFYIRDTHNSTFSHNQINTSILSDNGGWYNEYENYGFDLDNVSDTTLSSNDIDHVNLGIEISGSRNNISNNNISDVNAGINGGSYCIFNNNYLSTIIEASFGYGFTTGTHNNYTNNTIYSINDVQTFHMPAFDVQASHNNFVSNNVTSVDGHAFDINANNNTFIGNTVDGMYGEKGAFYSNDADYNDYISNIIIYTSEKGFYLSGGSMYNYLFNNTVLNADNGFETAFLLTSADHNELLNNTAENSSIGFYLDSNAFNNTLKSNIAYNNTNGFEIAYSDNNTFERNIAYKNSQSGFVITGYTPNYNLFTRNEAYNNSYGFHIYDSGSNPQRNLYTSNYIHDNTQMGFRLRGDYNNLTENVIINNPLGIRTATSSANNFIYNNYFNNTINANGSGTANSWYINPIEGRNIINGPNIGGNFWDDYFSQRNATDRDGDGFGDDFLAWNSNHSSKMAGNAADNYPLTVIRCGDELIGDTNIGIYNALTNCSTNGLNIIEDDISLDCYYHTILGRGSKTGINISDSDNVEIEHCIVKNFSNGVYTDNSDNLFAHLNTFLDNDIGANMSSTSDNGLFYNNAFNNTNDNNAYDAGNNSWNDPLLFGNCWSDYTQNDLDNSRDYNVSVIGGAVIAGTTPPKYSNIDYDPHPYDNCPLIECGVILTSDNNDEVINLTQNLYCPGENAVGFIDENTMENITFDCQGHTITGNGSNVGILYLGGGGEGNIQNITIRNCIISNFSQGMMFFSGATARVYSDCGNDRTNQEVRYNLIENNEITYCSDAILFASNEANSETDSIGTNYEALAFMLGATGWMLTGATGFGAWFGVGWTIGTILFTSIFEEDCDTYCAASDVYENIIKDNTLLNNINAIRFFHRKADNCDSGKDNAHVRDNTVINNLIANNSAGIIFDNNLGDASINPPRNNDIYNNNFIDNTLHVSDTYGNNLWNTSYSYSKGSEQNIIGGDSLGGNYWSGFCTLDNGSGITHPYNVALDSIGDTNYPFSSFDTNDYLPLSTNPGCGAVINQSYNLLDDLQNSTCGYTCDNGFYIDKDNVTLDCNGHTIRGNGSGTGIYVNNSNNVTIKNCIIVNFTTGIYFNSSDDGFVLNNTVYDNSIGINLTSSDNNLIYNNYFDNTENADDDSAIGNSWNTAKTHQTNIIGRPYIGGNYWSDYTGVDNNGDYLGNTNLPYNGTASINTGGDYLPLTYNTTAPPDITNVECNNKTDWINCSDMDYGINLTQIRVNCFGANNVSFFLKNIEDDAVKIDGNASYNLTGVWYYNYNKYILDSGNWTLNISCISDNGQDNYTESWELPWGVLVPYKVTDDRNVTNGTPFIFTAGVNCTIGECGDLNATLDPMIKR